MGNTTTVEMLADVSLGALLDEQERGRLAERVDVVKLEQGRIVVNVGDLDVHRDRGRGRPLPRTKAHEEMFFESPGPGDLIAHMHENVDGICSELTRRLQRLAGKLTAPK